MPGYNGQADSIGDLEALHPVDLTSDVTGDLPVAAGLGQQWQDRAFIQAKSFVGIVRQSGVNWILSLFVGAGIRLPQTNRTNRSKQILDLCVLGQIPSRVRLERRWAGAFRVGHPQYQQRCLELAY